MRPGLIPIVVFQCLNKRADDGGNQLQSFLVFDHFNRVTDGVVIAISADAYIKMRFMGLACLAEADVQCEVKRSTAVAAVGYVGKCVHTTRANRLTP